MDLDKDMLALPAEAELGEPPWDGVNVRIWENVS